MVRMTRAHNAGNTRYMRWKGRVNLTKKGMDGIISKKEAKTHPRAEGDHRNR